MRTIKTLYKVEKDTSSDIKAYRRQLKKIHFFLVIDMIFMVVSAIVLCLKYKPWETCDKNFNAWAITLTISSFASIFVDLW